MENEPVVSPQPSPAPPPTGQAPVAAPSPSLADLAGANATVTSQPLPRKKSQWFKRTVSTLIALVTVIGALVAWRANVAGSEAGDLDSTGLLALQNAEETRAVSFIEANGHEIAYIDYLRNRTLVKEMFEDGTLGNAEPQDAERVAREITQTIDLARTSKTYFFPGRYLDQDDNYDFEREVNEKMAQAEQSKDLNFQKHFDRSDALSNKVMGLLSMLVMLAVALWLLALGEVLSNVAKYALGLGGLGFMMLGTAGAYLIDGDSATPAQVSSFVWPVAWILGGITVVAALALAGLGFIRSRGRNAAPAVAGTATTAPGAPPPPAQPGAYPYQTPLPPPPSAPSFNPNAPGTPAPVYMPSPSGDQPTPPLPPAQAQTVVVAVPEAKDDEEKEEPFKQIVTVLIATVALIAAVIAYLQSDASNQAGGASRNVQQFALNALGERTYGTSEMSYNFYTVAHAWKQMDILRLFASTHGDEAEVKRYQAAMDELQSQSNIFDEAYFNPETYDVPDQYTFAANLYLARAVNLDEKGIVQLGLHSAWDAKASAYIAHLTLLAVALALFGLSLATSGLVRYIFSTSALAMVVATLFWSTATYTQPVVSVKEGAIDAYSKGVGLAWSGKTEEAIAAYDEAIALDPSYANAYDAKGNAHFDEYRDAYRSAYRNEEAGNTEQAAADYDLAQRKLEEAIADYEAARKAGKDDIYVGWNLGWAYYLLGRYDEAISMDRRVLDLDPNLIGVRLNLGLALLASGNYTEAETEYNTAIARTSDVINSTLDQGKTVSSDFWYFLDAGVADLDNLKDRIDGYEFTFTIAPERENIINPEETREVAFDLVFKLRDRISAFEYLAKNGEMPPVGLAEASVDSFRFMAKTRSEPEEIEGTRFKSDTLSVRTYYTYKDIKKGQRVSFKFYLNGDRLPEYDYVIDPWEYDEEGERWILATDPYDQYSDIYNLGSGLWTVELYVDHTLLYRGFFVIEDFNGNSP